MDREAFGAQIRALRSNRRLTQEQLGAALRVTAQAVAHWEAGRSLPPVTEAPALAAALNVSLEDLFDVGGADRRRATAPLASDQPGRIRDMVARRLLSDETLLQLVERMADDVEALRARLVAGEHG